MARAFGKIPACIGGGVILAAALALSFPARAAGPLDGANKTLPGSPPSSTAIPGTTGGGEVLPSATDEGRLADKAREASEASRAAITDREAAAARAATEAARSAACTGAVCTSAGDVSRAGSTGARDVADTAASLRKDANSRRDKLLDDLKSGKYSPEEVRAFRDLVRDDREPAEEEIKAALPPKMHDLARAYRINREEAAMLKETEDKYGKVSARAHAIGDTLKDNTARAASLSAATVGHVRASQSRAISSVSERDKPTLAGGRNQSAVTAPGTPALPDARESRAHVSRPGAAPAKEELNEEEKNVQEKKLSPEGAALIAGMIADLKNDVHGSRPQEESLDAAVGAGAVPGTPSPWPADDRKLSGEESTRQRHASSEDEILGSTAHPRILAMTGERSLADASAQEVRDMFFGSDKSLFTRVHEQIRRRAADQLK